MKIIVGLGNPGARYAGTRHNVGFAVIDTLAELLKTKVTKGHAEALVGLARLSGEEIVLVKPQAFMNLSGRPVAAILDKTGMGPADLVVVHDDIDLLLGKIKIRKSGGDGGHNGLASVIGALGTGSFARVKLGVGRPPEGLEPADYVLAPFDGGELPSVRDMVGRAADAVMVVIRDGPEKAMNRFNRAPDPVGPADKAV